MASIHAASGELIDILPFGPALRQAASETLVRADHSKCFGWCCCPASRCPGTTIPA